MCRSSHPRETSTSIYPASSTSARRATCATPSSGKSRISLFTKTNYLALRNQITKALISARLVITARRDIGYEDDTGYHHYSIDVSSFRACP